MGKLPKKSDMIKMDEEAAESKKEASTEIESKEKPAKSVMQAIGKSLLKPQTLGKKKKPKILSGPSSQNSKKQNRVDKPDLTKDADEQD